MAPQVAVNGGADRLAPLGEFAFADAGEAAKSSQVAGTPSGQFDQGRVVEDDIGRQAPALGLFLPPSAKASCVRWRSSLSIPAW